MHASSLESFSPRTRIGVHAPYACHNPSRITGWPRYPFKQGWIISSERLWMPVPSHFSVQKGHSRRAKCYHNSFLCPFPSFPPSEFGFWKPEAPHTQAAQFTAPTRRLIRSKEPRSRVNASGCGAVDWHSLLPARPASFSFFSSCVFVSKKRDDAYGSLLLSLQLWRGIECVGDPNARKEWRERRIILAAECVYDGEGCCVE
jgi:hypothetical protein